MTNLACGHPEQTEGFCFFEYIDRAGPQCGTATEDPIDPEDQDPEDPEPMPDPADETAEEATS